MSLGATAVRLGRPALRRQHRTLAAWTGCNHACASRQQPITTAAAASALTRWRPAATAVSSSMPHRQQLHTSGWRAQALTVDDIEADVGVLVEGEPAGLGEPELARVRERLYHDSIAVVKQAALYLISEEEEEREQPPAPLELSLVLCDDAHIQSLNKEWRGVDAPTDVLSFELEDDDEEDEDAGLVSPEMPINVLGDVVISLDTAARQASERRYTLLDESRVLLVHGVLHLLGYDHEEGEEEAAEMAAAEQHIMKALGWKGQGLIAAVGGCDELHGDGDSSSSGGRGG